jgi:hypothetical protein
VFVSKGGNEPADRRADIWVRHGVEGVQKVHSRLSLESPETSRAFRASPVE